MAVKMIKDKIKNAEATKGLLNRRKLKVSILALFVILMFIACVASAEGDSGKMKLDSMNGAVESVKPVPPPNVDGTYEKPSKAKLKTLLNDLQYKVTQKNGTERAFRNEFWDLHKEGIFVDIVSGEALFSSTDKFESGTGWPSFSATLADGNVVEIVDDSFGMTRTEVRSYFGDSHLGHLFNDGPRPTGLRYCINSASLRFIPVEDLKKEGYEEYLPLFAEVSGKE